MIALAVGRRAQQVVDVELGLAEEDVGALLLEHDDRAQQHADRRARHPAVLGEDRLALVRREELERRREVLEVEQRQVVVVAVLEDQREDRGLRLVEVEDLAQQQRPERVDRRPHLRAELAGQRQELDRVAATARTSRPSDVDALVHLRVGRVAGRGQAGQVALDVGHEDRHAGLRQLAGEQLERLGLAGAGRAGDQPVAVEHRQRDLDARVVGRARRRASGCR